MKRTSIVALVGVCGSLAVLGWQFSSPSSVATPSESSPAASKIPPEAQLQPPPAPVPPEGAPSACHDAPLTAAPVPIARASGRPADLGGGVLRDGTYDVTRYDVFGKVATGTIGSTFRQTLHVEGGGRIAKMVRIGRQGTTETTTWNLGAHGKELTLRGICPDGVVGTIETLEFGATEDDVQFRFEQAGVPVVVTYRLSRGAEAAL